MLDLLKDLWRSCVNGAILACAVLILLVLLGALLVVARSGGAPFIYTLF